jgi:molybdopterin-binding protein
MPKISGRNKIPCVVRRVVKDKLMAQVDLESSGGIHLTAIITRDAASELGLKKGKRVAALIKATEMMVIAD